MDFKPLGERIVVKRDDNVTELGSFIIAGDGEVQNRGTVRAVGPLVRDVKPGDYICFGKYDGSEQEIEGERVIMMKENQVWGIITDDI